MWLGARLIVHGVAKEVHSIGIRARDEFPEVVHEDVGVVVCSFQSEGNRSSNECPPASEALAMAFGQPVH